MVARSHSINTLGNHAPLLGIGQPGVKSALQMQDMYIIEFSNTYQGPSQRASSSFLELGMGSLLIVRYFLSRFCLCADSTALYQQYPFRSA